LFEPEPRSIELRALVGSRPHVYKPATRCIYCGLSREDARLTKEHIIPLSFDGRFIFPNASCVKCAGITSRFERTCSQQIFDHLRVHYQLPTRRPQNRPDAFPLDYNENGNTVTRMVPVLQHPFVVALPNFETAGMLADRMVSDRMENVEFRGFASYPMGLVPGPNSNFVGPSFNMQLRADPFAFARVLAKIAHGFAVAEYGMGAFTSFLTPIVLNQTNMVSYYVGSTPDKKSYGIASKLHILQLKEYHLGQATLLLCYIKLFAPFPFPIYEVVVGRFPKHPRLSKTAPVYRRLAGLRRDALQRSQP